MMMAGSDVLSRVGASIHSNFSEPYQRFLEYVDDLGIDIVKIKADIPEFLFALYDKKKRGDVKDVLDSFDLRLTMHAPYLNTNLSSLNEDIGGASLETVRRSLSLAGDLGIDMVSTHVGRLSKDLPGRLAAEATERAETSLKELKAYADERGIKLTIENDHKTTDHLLAGYPDQIFELIDAVDCGFTLDVGHANTLVEPTQFVSDLADRIVDVHLHDNYGDHDSHLAVGEGNIDFRRFFEALQRVNFEGVFIMEQHRLQDLEIGYGRLRYISKYVGA
jgi:sugar phosphate isomerase/epimerase